MSSRRPRRRRKPSSTVTPLSSVLEEGGDLSATMAKHEAQMAAEPNLFQGSRGVPAGVDIPAVQDALDATFKACFPLGSAARGQRVWTINFGLRQSGELAMSVSSNGGRRLNDAEFELLELLVNEPRYSAGPEGAPPRTASNGG